MNKTEAIRLGLPKNTNRPAEFEGKQGYWCQTDCVFIEAKDPFSAIAQFRSRVNNEIAVSHNLNTDGISRTVLLHQIKTKPRRATTTSEAGTPEHATPYPTTRAIGGAGEEEAVDYKAAYDAVCARNREHRATIATLRAALTTPPTTPEAGGAWVSVKERLPPRVEKEGNPMWYSEYVLLHIGFHKLPVIAYYDFRESYECFQSNDKDEELPVGTHWQPLPAAPSCTTTCTATTCLRKEGGSDE